MIEETVAPLFLANALGEIRGKTRFQKLTFIIQKKAKAKNIKGLAYDYEPYLYGPFSTQLASNIDNLVRNRNLSERQSITRSGYTVFVYSLTPQGRQTLGRVLKSKVINSELIQTINGVAKEYGELPLPELVMLAKQM